MGTLWWPKSYGGAAGEFEKLKMLKYESIDEKYILFFA